MRESRRSGEGEVKNERWRENVDQRNEVGWDFLQQRHKERPFHISVFISHSMILWNLHQSVHAKEWWITQKLQRRDWKHRLFLKKVCCKGGLLWLRRKKAKKNNYNPLCKNPKGLIYSFLAGGSNKHVTFEHWVWRKFEKQELLRWRFPQKRRRRQSTKERPLRGSLMKPPHTVEKDVAGFSFRTEGGGLFCPRAGTERPLKTETSATQPHWVEKIFMTPLSDLPASINIISISMVWTGNIYDIPLNHFWSGGPSKWPKLLVGDVCSLFKDLYSNCSIRFLRTWGEPFPSHIVYCWSCLELINISFHLSTQHLGHKDTKKCFFFLKTFCEKLFLKPFQELDKVD